MISFPSIFQTQHLDSTLSWASPFFSVEFFFYNTTKLFVWKSPKKINLSLNERSRICLLGPGDNI
jgi:hypothetical protein